MCEDIVTIPGLPARPIFYDIDIDPVTAKLLDCFNVLTVKIASPQFLDYLFNLLPERRKVSKCVNFTLISFANLMYVKAGCLVVWSVCLYIIIIL